ncbi:encapsulin-associated ferritin-like protein [Anaerococcus sp. AGMB09787]|uniref:encapsulin-associated ferritin-like protein n=1 Tax=Anaerococcus sp. AGMB09787 TaxID=2922869 RepID=UPI001FB02DA7|nr:encapsulin-associated ferritin-like protein [Anaerococcus sp. AGMB09787]
MSDYHEPAREMSSETRDIIRGLKSLIEEIEAVFWYTQRVEVSDDEELKEIMWHNAVEEMEHAMMSLEWVRRHQDGWDEQMRTYLFTDGSIMDAEENEEDHSSSEDASDLGIGEL